MVSSIASATEDFVFLVRPRLRCSRAKDGTMYYTYVLESVSKPDERYIGHSANLKQRLREHNADCALRQFLRTTHFCSDPQVKIQD
ncbi:MAG: hypothetical protein CVU64_19955 [Deltaproteobacteria bacterium HGW-Deltaproteobacteria-21]|nr:MAG: hypothetical protein CVU64_19955 [Deltaproteobacteria bacterium HGW-Deltaproteobacteria-21]